MSQGGEPKSQARLWLTFKWDHHFCHQTPTYLYPTRSDFEVDDIFKVFDTNYLVPTYLFQKHRHIITSENPFECSICNSPLPFECKFCQKRFRRSHHLKTHVRLHTGERPYSCTHCDRKFVQVANLRRHILYHTCETEQSSSH